jgi:hypothetical protein
LYDLVGQQLLKTLMTGLKWISSLDIHPLYAKFQACTYSNEEMRLMRVESNALNGALRALEWRLWVIIEVQGTPKQVTWHRKGDYFATVAVDGKSLL